MSNATTTQPQQTNKNAPANQNHQQQLVPEAVLKRRHDMDEMKAKRAAQLLDNPRGNRKIFSKSKNIVVIKPEKFVLYNRNKIGLQRRFDRVKRKGMQKRASKKVIVEKKTIPADNEEGEDREVPFKANSIGSPFLFVIRVRTRAAVPKKVAGVLSALRLKNQNDGVFLKNTRKSFKLLQLVDPFVIYGVPSKQTVLDLIKRRGFANINKQRIPLSDNVIIEEELGKDTGIICVEDLVETITSAEMHAFRAMRFLWPFKFSAIYTKFQKMVLNEKDNKEYGDIGERMDDFIRKML